MINKKKFQPSKILDQIKDKIEQLDDDVLENRNKEKNSTQEPSKTLDKEEINKEQNLNPMPTNPLEENFFVEEDDEFDFDFLSGNQDSKQKQTEKKKEVETIETKPEVIESSKIEQEPQKVEVAAEVKEANIKPQEIDKIVKAPESELDKIQKSDLKKLDELQKAQAEQKEISQEDTAETTQDDRERNLEPTLKPQTEIKVDEEEKLDFDEIVKNNSTLSSKKQDTFIQKPQEITEVEKEELEKKPETPEEPEAAVIKESDTTKDLKEVKESKEEKEEEKKEEEEAKITEPAPKIKLGTKRAKKLRHIKSDFSWEIYPEEIKEEMRDYEDDDLDFDDEVEEGFGESWDWGSEAYPVPEEPFKTREKQITKEVKEETTKEPVKKVEAKTKESKKEEITKTAEKAEATEKPQIVKPVTSEAPKAETSEMDMEDFLNQEIDEDEIKEKTKSIVGLRTWKEEKPEEKKEKEQKEDEMVGIKEFISQKEMKSDEELLKELLELEEKEKKELQPKQPEEAKIIDAEKLESNYKHIPEEALISRDTQRQVTDSISEFSDMFPKKQELMSPQMFSGGQSVGQMVYNILEPKLEEWVNQNLPNMVEKVIQKEIKKLIPKDED